ncbi:hypothetical protein N9N67_04905 [Bacteriovoracaceae bacterium]|nr:hypothetical protein [Bacteriovoracaceae bacterium]
MAEKSEKTNLIEVGSLNGFFYERLEKLNQKSLTPVPNEVLFYSSNVLQKFSLSEEFFNYKDGKVTREILGVKFLETKDKTSTEKKRIYQEIGDSALFLSGYFSKAVKNEIVDINYYRNVGKMAYENLNEIVPQCFDVPSFFDKMSTCFYNVSILFSVMAENFGEQNKDKFLLDISNDLEDEELLIRGFPTNQSKKVS